jgi:hypothetical protein
MPLHTFWSQDRLRILIVAFVILIATILLISVILYPQVLNSNSGAITVFFSGLVAMSTTVYAVLTWVLVSETRKMREAQTEPNISISLQQRGRWGDLLDLVIQNIGLGEAFDVKFEVKTDFRINSPMKQYQNPFQDLNIIKNGLNHIAPNQSYVFFLTSARAVETVPSFEIKVHYKNNGGVLLPEKIYQIDFSTFTGIIQGGDPLEKIADNIANLRSS